MADLTTFLAEIDGSPGVLGRGALVSQGVQNAGTPTEYHHYTASILYQRSVDSIYERDFDVYVYDEGGAGEDAQWGRIRLDLFRIRMDDFIQSSGSEYQVAGIMRESESFSAIRYSGATAEPVVVTWNGAAFVETVVTSGAELLLGLL